MLVVAAKSIERLRMRQVDLQGHVFTPLLYSEIIVLHATGALSWLGGDKTFPL